MASKDDAKPRKIIDVTEPGKTAASPTAKPIIVSNRPMLKQDPMMVPAADSKKSEVDAEDAEPTVSRVGKPIAVMIDQAKKEQEPEAAKAATPPRPPEPAKPEAKLAPTPPDKPAEFPTKPTPTEPPKAEMPVKPALAPTMNAAVDSSAVSEAKPMTDEAATPPESTAAPSAPSAPEIEEAADESQASPTGDDQMAPSKLTEEAKRKADEEQAAKVAEQEKIIASKKYYLPIKAAESRRSMRRALLLLILVVLVALVWFDAVLDAGILHVPGIHAVTHFFQN